jgi:hypothetical protein
MYNRNRRDLLQDPIGTLVGTVATTAKCEDVSLDNNLNILTSRVLISPSIWCGASNGTIHPYVCHEVLLLSSLRENPRAYWHHFRVTHRAVSQSRPIRCRGTDDEYRRACSTVNAIALLLEEIRKHLSFILAASELSYY